MSPPPEIGKPAPPSEKLRIPPENGKPVVLTFLRHCGCPFAEKTYLTFRSTASAHPSIRFIAISHSDRLSTDRWLDSIGGPTPSKVEVIVDNERSLYAAWGRGASSYWHALFPAALGSAIKLGREEGLWNRPTESGSLWQTSGSWVVDVGGVVRWGGASGRMDEIPDFEEAVKAVEGH